MPLLLLICPWSVRFAGPVPEPRRIEERSFFFPYIVLKGVVKDGQHVVAR